MLRRVFAAALPLALLAVAPHRPARGQEPRVVELHAKRFQFTPNAITLKKDEPVVLRLTSEDVIHGFFSRDLGLNTTIAPGKVTEVAVTPHAAGRFLVICHHFCGAGHGGMNLTVVVE